jgi:hypothetical protein
MQQRWKKYQLLSGLKITKLLFGYDYSQLSMLIEILKLDLQIRLAPSAVEKDI